MHVCSLLSMFSVHDWIIFPSSWQIIIFCLDLDLVLSCLDQLSDSYARDLEIIGSTYQTLFNIYITNSQRIDQVWNIFWNENKMNYRKKDLNQSYTICASEQDFACEKFWWNYVPHLKLLKIVWTFFSPSTFHATR